MRIALGIEYDGSRYFGWQRQREVNSVQSELEQALSRIANHNVEIQCAGRTDAGVHATGQVIHFDTVAERKLSAWTLGVNANLPSDIAVRWVTEVEDDFHARFSATGKLYSYRILNSLRPDPLQRNYCWQIAKPLNVAAMQSVMTQLVGEHHFGAFQSSGSSAKHPVRTLYTANCSQHGELLEFQLHGNGFLYHMVRNIVGTIVDVGTGKLSADEFQRIFVGRDRRQAGATAPGAGLCLLRVFYEKP